VLDTLTLAFAADPAVRWMYPDRQQYLRSFPAFAYAFGGSAIAHRTAFVSERLPAYLESTNPRNILLYERHGFEVIGAIRIGNCSPIFPMLRVAR
jgi:hypothetical protein